MLPTYRIATHVTESRWRQPYTESSFAFEGIDDHRCGLSKCVNSMRYRGYISVTQLAGLLDA